LLGHACARRSPLDTVVTSIKPVTTFFFFFLLFDVRPDVDKRGEGRDPALCSVFGSVSVSFSLEGGLMGEVRAGGRWWFCDSNVPLFV